MMACSKDTPKDSPLTKYLSTLEDYQNSVRTRNDNTAKVCWIQRYCWRSVFIQIALPFPASVFLTLLGISFGETSNIISVVSIIAGLMCAVATLLFDIRAGLMNESSRYKGINKDEINDLYYLNMDCNNRCFIRIAISNARF